MPTKTNRISFQGEPGANSDTACRNIYPDDGAAALPDLRGRLQRGRDRQGRPRHDPDREHDRRARRRHPPSAAGIAAAHRRRIFPADPFPADGAAGRQDATRSRRSTATSMRSANAARSSASNGWKPVVAGDTAGAAKLVAEDRRPHAWRRWRRALAADALRPRHHRGECRGHRKQRHPLRRPVARTSNGPSAAAPTSR